MAVLFNVPIAGLLFPSGPLQSQLVRFVYGRVTLAAGVFNEALGTDVLPAAAVVLHSRRVTAGVPGFISAANNGAGTIAFASSNAGDTSSVDYLALIFG